MKFPCTVLNQNKAYFELQEREHNGVTLFHPVWHNPDSNSIEAADMTASWQLPSKDLLPNAVIKSDSQGDHYERYDLSALSAPLSFDGHAILRSLSGGFILFGIVTMKKQMCCWQIKVDSLALTFFADGRPLYPGEIWEGDFYCCIQSDNLYDLQKKYGELLAELNPRKRKRQTTLWRGWGSWDYYASVFSDKVLLENFQKCRELYPEANLLQIDEGYSLRPDWLNVKKDSFPDGMAAFVKKVRAMNAHVGIWMSPFLADCNSVFFKKHPGWCLYRADGALELVSTSGNYALLDYSQPEVCEWWRNILHTARREWGIEYFKFDFLRHGLNPCLGKYPMTSAERFQKCFDIIEEVFGDDTFLLGCSTTFTPTLGRVDADRVGPDISPNFKSVIETAFGNISTLYMQGRVLRGDGDYLVVRSGEEDQDPSSPPPHKNKIGTLTKDEAKLWGDVVSMFNGTILESDNLMYLREERCKIAAEALATIPADEVFPLDLFSGDGLLPPSAYLIRRGNELELACFNWSENEKTIVLCEAPGKEYFKIILRPHTSHRELLQETRSFEEMAKLLFSPEKETPRSFPSFTCKPFLVTGSFQPLPLGKAATVSIDLDRKRGCMCAGSFADLMNHEEICGIPFDFKQDSHRVIEYSMVNKEGFSVEVDSKVKALYFIQGVSMVVQGDLFDYTFVYEDGTRAVETQIVGDHFGNFDFEYSTPWKGSKGHIGWYEPVTHCIMFVTEWLNPYPEKKLLRIEASSLKKNGKLYVAGITALK